MYVAKDLFGVLVIECECNKSYDVGKYLDHENCKCRKKLVDKLIEECAENIDEVKLAKITLAENGNKHKYSSCTLYIVLFSVIFTIKIGISTYFIYFYWYLKEDVICIKCGTCTRWNCIKTTMNL